MRLSKTVSITLPPEMLARAMELAKAENRTMSELIREALRQYERQQHVLISSDDVAVAVKQVRKQLWPAYKKKLSAKPKKA